MCTPRIHFASLISRTQQFPFLQTIHNYKETYDLVLHNISVNHGCVDDINEEILEDLRRCDVELHVPMPLNPNAPAAARERRDRRAASSIVSNPGLMLDYIAKISPCIHNLVIQ